MPIIDDVLERDLPRMGMAVADGNAFSETRSYDEMAHVHALVADGSQALDADRLAGVSRTLQAAVKRGVDIAISALVLALSLPLIAIIALLVVIDSRGPVFYRAERV